MKCSKGHEMVMAPHGPDCVDCLIGDKKPATEIYFTVLIPFAPREFRTPFHPDTDVGPFSTLTRGVFRTRAEAITWARENLNGTPYTIKLEGGPDNGAAPPWLSDVAQALGYVRPDGTPMALNWSQALEAIRELRRGRDYWQKIAIAMEKDG